MQDFEYKDLPENDEIEISDLDSPDEQGKLSRLQRIMKFVETHFSSRRRTILLTLALLIGGCVFIYSFISYLHISIIQTIQARLAPTATHPHTSTTSVGITIGSDVTIQSIPPNNLSVVNGIAYISTPDGTLSARQANDGTFLWQTKTAIPLSPPAVVDNTIYITSENSQNGHIDAFRANDGNLQWSSQTPLLVIQPILVEDGVVYIETQTGTVYALRATDGKLLWHFTVGNSTNGNPLRLETLLSASNGVTVIRTNNQILYFLRSQDGSQLWHYAIDVSAPPPDIENGIVYITYHSLQARSLSNGKLLWQYTGDVQSYDIQHTVIYLNIGNQVLLALNGQTGKPMWQFQTNKQIDTTDEQNGMLLLTMLDGTVTALKDQTGSILWQFKPPTHSSIFWLSGTKEEVLYVGLDASTITFYALQANNGHALWSQSVHNIDQNYSPHITNGLIYAKQIDGYINAWSSNDGHLIWHSPSSTSLMWNLIEANGLVYLQQPDGSILALHVQNGKVAWRYPA
jgi:eukaryotic-like serine/threonine-protein kinase